MKQSNLLSILILFFSLLNVQYVVATEKTADQFISTTYPYTISYSGYTSKINITNDNLNVNLKYPCNYLTFTGVCNTSYDNIIRVDKFINNWSEQFRSSKWSQWLGEKEQSAEGDIDPKASAIAFVKIGGTATVQVKNPIFTIAPHTRLLSGTDGTTALANHNVIAPAVFNTEFNTPLHTQHSRTIKFYSALAGESGLTISINTNNVDTSGLNLNLYRKDVQSEIYINKNSFLDIDNKANWDFEIRYKPTKLIKDATIYIRISNPNAVNADINIPVKLSSSLAPPTLNHDGFGYKYAKLKWNAVSGADKYKLYVYQGDNRIKTYETTNTTLTITENITYNNTYSFKVTSVKGTYESEESDAISITTDCYPQIQNVHFSNVEQNQVTVNWNPITNLPANHSFVQYHIHLWQPYASETEGTFIKAITTTGTSCDFTGLIDNTQYTAYVDVEYQYTLNGETKNVHESFWSSASITTASFVPSDPFDGVLMYQGIWYRVNLNSTIDITNKELTFNLGYPCNELKFTTSAGGGSINNTIAVKEDGNKTYTTPSWLGTDGTKHFETTISTSTSNLSISRNSGTTSNAAKLNIWNIGLNIVPHTKIATESENISFNTPITKTTSDEKTIQLQSVLTANNGLKFEIVEKKGDTYIPTTLSNDIITLYLSDTYKGQSFHIQSNNTLVKHKDTKDSRGEKIHNSGSWDVKVLFNPKGNIMNRSDIYVCITNKGAEINSVKYIPITLKSSLDTPENLNCNAYGYTYANLSWSKVESATGYKIYDNNNLVATISDGNTTNTRINLPYAETNHSISISSIFSDSESDKSNPITFTSPVYPKPNEEIVTINNITTSGFTISWGATTTATDTDQPMVDYEIIFWEFDDQGNPEPVGNTAAIIDHTTNTSYTCTSLKENTAYSIFVGVRTQIKGTNEYINPITIEHADRIETYWSYNFSRTNLTTEQTKGLYFYKNNWCIVDFNEDHDITNNEFAIPTLGYPCNQIKFTANAAAWTTGNTVGVKEDETKTYNTTSWDGGAISSTNNTGETNINPKTKTVSIFKNSGSSTSLSKLKVRNIILEIAPHILLNGTEDVVIDQDASSATSSKASINFEEITIGEESEVKIDFKSFLASGNITATLSDNKNFKINNLTDGVIAQNNTLEQLEINDHNFTVSFTPQEKTDDPDNRDYSATLTIKDDANTVVINLNGKSKYRSVSIENKAIPDYYDETTYYSTITHTVTYSDADLADWLWISSPFDAEISIKHNTSGTELPLTWAGNPAPKACYLLKYYDTAERAQGEVKPWKDVKNTDGKPTIEAGKGYILGVDPRDYTGYFTITYTSVDKEKNASNKNGYSDTTQNHLASDPILSNIHLVGSGLFENAVGVNINSSDNVYFAVRAEAGSSNYYNYYFQNSAPIAPYSSFFMQYAGEYTFTTSQTIRQNAPAAFNNEKPTEYYQLNIVSEKYTDKTMILMAHNGSEGYAVGQDFFYMTQQAAGGNIANQFYSLDGDNPLSFNHRKNENQTIALGGCVKSAGEYSISLEGSNISAQSVVLYDIFTDTTVDLLSEEYNFTTEKGSLNERFIITFSFAPQTTTEIFTPIANQIIVSGNAQNCTIDNLIIGKEVMIFDVMGRLIFNEKTNNETINISLPAGTYIVRQADNWAKFAIR